MTQDDVHSRIAAHRAKGERVVLATVVRTAGSAPRKAGARLVVFEDGSFFGTICGGCVEAEVYQAARRLHLEGGKPQILAFTLNEADAEAQGLRCGGQMEVFVERIEPARRVTLFGAGHIAQALAKILVACEVETHVVDDHPGFVNSERFPGCVLHPGSFSAGAEAVAPGPGSVAIVMSRSHKNDLEALRGLARIDLGYWGVVASKKRAAEFLALLSREGASAARLERLRAPVGLDLGAETPAEIAVAIAAELLAFYTRTDVATLTTAFRATKAGRR